ncbi:MAG: DNA endonuclease SmrA [Pseudomonadota bacterium]
MSDSTNEDDLFREAMGDVAPLKTRATAERGKPGAPTAGQQQRRHDAQHDRDEEGDERGLTLAEVPPVDPHAELGWKQDGVQRQVFERLRGGDYPVEASLDLHHKTVKEARLALWNFLTAAHDSGKRCVLVAHGRGEKSPTPARLKSFVVHWLTHVPLVIAWHTAPPRLGGTGAALILVRKSREGKAQNRELHGGRAE